MLSETNDYLRHGFSIETKSRIPDKQIFGFDRAVTDTMCAKDAIAHGLLHADGIELTDKGFKPLCHLKS
ncbi:MAG: hypothetical protein LH702_33365 [Phormidesmis sp. CAN_BIN44]|nr:hypothetical protein [Phormidesmis sp. CAN_BIN44]